MIDTTGGRLRGKIAIVTGGGSGIGRATALRMAAEGASVCIGDIDAVRGHATVSAIEGDGGSAVFVEADVSRSEAAERLARTAVDRFGALHILHNNAYWAVSGRTVVALDEADWDRALAVCLKSMYLMSHYAIPHMLESGGGSIVNMASVVALVGTRANPAYAAAKGAVISFTKSLAIDYGKQGVRANCVAPGAIGTGPGAEQRRADPAWQEYVLEHTLLARTGTPEDIANAVLFLASDESAYITGTMLVVDGGATSVPYWSPAMRS